MGIILAGSYLEHIAAPMMTTFGDPPLRFDPTPSVVLHRPGDVVIRDAEHTHRVELFQDDRGPIECWTLFLVGRRARDWGFHCANGWTPWQQFCSEGPDGLSVGCG